MSRRTRYTPEQKVKIVTACIDGENSIRGIARQYRISGGRIASVPGPGGIIAEFIGYAQEKTLAKRQQEMFDLINPKSRIIRTQNVKMDVIWQTIMAQNTIQQIVIKYCIQRILVEQKIFQRIIQFTD